MNRLAQALAELAANLRDLDARWALIDGLAISARATPRTTFDLDLAVAVADDRGAEALVRALVARGYRHEALHLEHDTEQSGHSPRLAMVRLSPPDPDLAVPIDLLFASSGLEPEITVGAETLEVLPEVRVPVARVEHLIATKILAGRLQDQADAANLLQGTTAGERALARAALEIIEARGFARGKNQRRELDDVALRAGIASDS